MVDNACFMCYYIAYVRGIVMRKITNKSEFDELIEKIKECLVWYEETKFERVSYNLRLDNGEDLRILFGPNTVAHLLGINTEYLKATGLFKGTSYEILKFICNDPYRVYNMVRGGHLSYDSFVSDFTFEKLSGFNKVCGINLGNMEFVCKYSRENSYVTGHEQLEGDYYIAYKTDDGLFVVGFKKNNGYYYPMTNRFIDINDKDSMRFLEILLTNQVITMPTYSYLYYFRNGSRGDNLYVNYNRKGPLLEQLKEYANKYNAIVDVAVGYGYVVGKLLEQFESNSNYVPILIWVSDSIKMGVKINEATLKKKFGRVPESIRIIIEGYNNLLNNGISAALDEHTSSVELRCDRLENENSSLRRELEDLKRQLLSMGEENSRLSQENERYAQNEAAIMKILTAKR